MKKTYLIGLLIIMILGACQPFKFQTFHAEDPEKYKGKGFFYALPKTHIKLIFHLEKETFYPGIYARYAEELLGINDLPLNKKSNWRIRDISFITKSSPDPDQFFFTSFSKGEEKYIQQVKKVLSPYPVCHLFNNNYTSKETGLNKDTTFQDKKDLFYLSPRGIKKEVIDTLYKTTLQDSIFVKKPVYKKRYVKKSTFEKASEVSRILASLRRTRLDLISINEEITDGVVLQTKLKEIKKLEKEYFQLFEGYSSKTNHHIYKNIQLDSITKPKQQIFLGHFSTTKGPGKGDSLMLTIEKTGIRNALEKTIPAGEAFKNQNNHLFIRYPEIVRFCVRIGEEKVFETTEPIHQWGKVVQIPFKK